MAFAPAIVGPLRKVVITNYVDGNEVVAQYLPEKLNESLGPNWARLQIPGLSFEPLQFVNTPNPRFKFDLLFRATSTAELRVLRRARLLLFSWCYPRSMTLGLRGGAPKLLLSWPKMLSIDVVLNSIEIDHQVFNRLGHTVCFNAACQWEMVGGVHLTSEEVAEGRMFVGDEPLDVESLSEVLAIAGYSTGE